MHIGDDLIQDIFFFIPRGIFLRWDVLPFLVAYLLSFYCLLAGPTHLKYFGFFFTPAVLVIQITLFLLAQFSTSFRVKLGNAQTGDISKAVLVLVKAAKNVGSDKIVPIVRLEENAAFNGEIKIAHNAFEIESVYFEFQNVKYGYNNKKVGFEKLKYPSKGKISDFLLSTGHSEKEFIKSHLKWGYNEFDIPLPGFLDLYLEHLIAPFFLFQVLCLFLWSLDDYWYYSVFTLLMLMFFEGMLCRQRQNSILMLRNMRRPPVPVFAYRDSTWRQHASDEIVPGDLISLVTNTTASSGSRARGDEGDSTGGAEVVPCDALLLQGSCVVNEAMLTGESVPQVKESLWEEGASPSSEVLVELGVDSPVAARKEAEWRRHMLYSGTSLMQHTAGTVSSTVPPPPDGGCVALVIRTGFGTSQGSLMRKILFASERVNINSLETVYFIGVLVVFALVASAAVLIGGLQDENRNKFRLALHCVMIVTSVVPPELPMELSLAVTNSLATLSRGLVFCTEPFRIAYAGKLDVICFDKTGTITKDKMILRGVSLPLRAHAAISLPDIVNNVNTSHNMSTFNEETSDSTPTDIMQPAVCCDIVRCVMAACHSLFISNGKILGDPMEVAAMEASGFKLSQYSAAAGSIAAISSEASTPFLLKIMHRYAFSSALKRMSVIVQYEPLGLPKPLKTRNLFVFTKGAPEVLAAKLGDRLPPDYKAVYRFHMSRGKRVLALAYKHMLTVGTNVTAKPSREEVESGLTFAGFLVYDCDLKPDSRSVIKELRNSMHTVVMITGDSAYTAADVARRVGILRCKSQDSSVLILQTVRTCNSTVSSLVWRSAGEDDCTEPLAGDLPFSQDVDVLTSLYAKYDLCVSGPTLDLLTASTVSTGSTVQAGSTDVSFHRFCQYIGIFARVSPEQKEVVVRALNELGLTTLMCGDGTNDVGALKAAHVGVSIVNDADFESKVEALAVAEGAGQEKGTGAGKRGKAKGSSSKDRMARAMSELHEQEKDPTIVKLGDASVASPFTARRTSIDSVLTVLRQGRCTLVTTTQVYKILALNCLVSAYLMSALYLRGLKQGDAQMTAAGLFTAGLFFLLSQAQPVLHIADRRPPASVFCKAVLTSIGGQFLVHLLSLFAALQLCETHLSGGGEGDSPSMTIAPDGKFQPNIINSSLFVLTSAMQVNNFVINYRGKPYTQSIQENVWMWRAVQAAYLSLIVVTGGQLLPLNDLLQMAPFPSANFQICLLVILLLNFACAYGVEKFSQTLE